MKHKNHDLLSVLRIDMGDHPIINAKYTLKKSYMSVFYKYIKHFLPEYEEYFEEYYSIYVDSLLIKPDDLFDIKRNYANEKYFNESLHNSKKTYFSFDSFLKLNIGNYRKSLFVDIVNLIVFFNRGKYKKDEILQLGKNLGLSKNTTSFLLDYCVLLFERKFEQIKKLFTSPSRKLYKKQIWFLLNRYENSAGFDKMPKFNVAVVATMSAGKSTFLNSIIGRNLFPAKNQACTFKPISISDNDNLNYTIAKCAYTDGKTEICRIVDEKKIVEWNDNTNVESLHVESNIIGIKNDKFAIVLYDTPGTNFSQNKQHKEITYKLLDTKPFDLILFLINASQVHTDDEKVLLAKIREVLTANPKTSILFLLNKADSFDIDGFDSFDETMNNINNDLQKLGFKSPNIIPVSTYAAKLFKLVLSGSALTQKEKQDFHNYLSLFSDKAYYLPDYARINFTAQRSSNNSKTKIKIGEKHVSFQQIHNALWATGVPLIENYLDHLV